MWNGIKIETWRNEGKDHEKESEGERKERLVKKRWGGQVSRPKGRLEKTEGNSEMGDASIQAALGWLHCVFCIKLPGEPETRGPLGHSRVTAS